MWVKDGQVFSASSLVYNGRRIFNPTDEMMIEAGYVWQDPAPPEPTPKKYSRLKIVRFLGEAWPTYKAQIEDAGLLDQFTYADYLKEDDPVFVAFLETIPDEIKEHLDECLWEKD